MGARYPTMPSAAYIASQLLVSADLLASATENWYRTGQRVIASAGWRSPAREPPRCWSICPRRRPENKDRQHLLEEAVHWLKVSKALRPGLSTLEEWISAALRKADVAFDTSVISAICGAAAPKLVAGIGQLIAGDQTRVVPPRICRLSKGPRVNPATTI